MQRNPEPYSRHSTNRCTFCAVQVFKNRNSRPWTSSHPLPDRAAFHPSRHRSGIPPPSEETPPEDEPAIREEEPLKAIFYKKVQWLRYGLGYDRPRCSCLMKSAYAYFPFCSRSQSIGWLRRINEISSRFNFTQLMLCVPCGLMDLPRGCSNEFLGCL